MIVSTTRPAVTTVSSTTTVQQPKVKALAEPVYLNGELPNPEGRAPLAVVNDTSSPVDVVMLNEKVVQVESPDGLRIAISAVDENGEPLPIDSTGTIIVENQQSFSVSGRGFAGGTEAVVWLFSTPRRLGLLPVSPSGDFSGSFKIDNSVVLGDHTVQVNGIDTNGSVRSMNLDLEVRKPTSVLAPQPAASPPLGRAQGSEWMWWLLAAIGGGGLAFILVARRRRSKPAN